MLSLNLLLGVGMHRSLVQGIKVIFTRSWFYIRGGGGMGRQWYENRKYLKKKNTFTDIIACAEY